MLYWDAHTNKIVEHARGAGNIRNCLPPMDVVVRGKVTLWATNPEMHGPFYTPKTNRITNATPGPAISVVKLYHRLVITSAGGTPEHRAGIPFTVLPVVELLIKGLSRGHCSFVNIRIACEAPN